MKKKYIHAVEQTLEPFHGATPQVNQPTKGFVIVEKELGVYLGSFWGMGFWSKVDPVGQPSATCFESKEEAQSHIDSWFPCEVKRDYTFHEVDVTHWCGEGMFAFIASCEKAGLDGWIDSEMPVANEYPI